REPADHTDNRVVLCDPVGGGFLSKLLGRGRPRPARWMTQPLGDQRVVHFTSAGTALMEQRARATFDTFRTLYDDLQEFELPALVKLGYVIDNADEPTDREHLWFRVDGLPADGSIDGTLLNQPFAIARMTEGQRERHSVDLLTEWQIMTPIGS